MAFILPKKILVACDSFKEALSAVEVGESIKKGLRGSSPPPEVIHCPLADGGEGSLAAFVYYSGAEKIERTVHDPLGRKTTAAYALEGKEKIAFVEMAQASGLELIKAEERDPLITTTFGAGQLIRKAIRRGARKIILGIGGSATHDGGLGMARALGYRFFDRNNEELHDLPQQTEAIDRIAPPQDLSVLQSLEVSVLCDVDNPLTGPEGAAYTYALQKGAQPEQLDLLDRRLDHLAKVWKDSIGLDLSETKGAGAAGGLGAGAVAFLGAEMRSGVDYFIELADLKRIIPTVDLIITGEGKIDRQSLRGKLIKGIVGEAQKHRVPVIGLCGELEPEVIDPLGLRAAFSIMMKPQNLAEALKETALNLENTATQLGRILQLLSKF